MSFYIQDPNNPNKQVPVIKPVLKSVSNAHCPPARITNRRPTYVTINNSGSYAFLYETTSSIGGVLNDEDANFITGSIVQSANAGPIRLDINPVAWRKTDAQIGVAEHGSSGDITFVFVRIA
jgi:hypothetical protein